MAIEGTCNFVSKAAADRCYREMGYNDANNAIAEGAIFIGKPHVEEGDVLSVIRGEERYQITYQDKPAVVAATSTLSINQEIALLIVDGGVIRLPKTMLGHYPEIKRLLQTSGGKYNDKGFFSFADGVDVAAVLAAMLNGGVINGKKDSQSFFTPASLAIRVCAAVGPLAGKSILEPSAGDGALADIARKEGANVTVVENYTPNIVSLTKKGYTVVKKDFLSVTPAHLGYFDVVVANPPFSANQDIDHILHMATFLRPGGQLSAISSQAWLKGTQKKHVAFREFLKKHNAQITEIEAGAFNESGTNVATTHIVLCLASQ